MYDYVAGKLDWLAAGLPTDGTRSDEPTAGSVARRDAPTCRLIEHVGDVRRRVRATAFDVCAVVNAEHVVLGFLRSDELSLPDDTRAEDAMQAAPSTFRPHVPIAEMAEYMERDDLPNAPVTTADGRLVGVLFREDAVGAARRSAARRRVRDS